MSLAPAFVDTTLSSVPLLKNIPKTNVPPVFEHGSCVRVHATSMKLVVQIKRNSERVIHESVVHPEIVAPFFKCLFQA